MESNRFDMDLTWVKPDLPDFTHDANGQEIRFEGKTNLRQANVALALTKDHITEYVRCSMSLEYFCNNYVKIVSLDEGLIYFDINSRQYQRRFLKHIQTNRHTCSKLGRQSGKTTMVCAYILWYILFNDLKFVSILSYGLEHAQEIMYKLQEMYENLPKWLQQGIIGKGKRSLVLENGTRVKVNATSPNSSTGYSINLLVLDEFAKVAPHIAEKFIASAFPTISSSKDAKIMIFSTPVGLNHFYKLYTEDNKFASFKIDWWEVPGRDENFKNDIIRTEGEEHWNQEYACEFLGSSNTLVNAQTLGKLARQTPIETRLDGKLRIYEEPKPGRKYAFGIDASQGVGEDYHAIEGFDVTEYPIKQVLSYECNDVKIGVLSEMVRDLGNHYNKAMLVIENNNTGVELVNRLHDELEYENILAWTYQQSRAQRRFGINMNKLSKIIACQRFKEVLESDKMIICDETLIAQCKTFVSKGSNRGYAAETNYHDDKIMASILLAFFLSLPDYPAFLDDEVSSSFDHNVLQRDLELFAQESIKYFGRVDEELTYISKILQKKEHTKVFIPIEEEKTDMVRDLKPNQRVDITNRAKYDRTKDRYNFHEEDNWLLSD